MHGSTGGSWKRSDRSGSPKWDNPTGNCGHQGFGTYRQTLATAPAPDPTHANYVDKWQVTWSVCVDLGFEFLPLLGASGRSGAGLEE